MPCSAHNWDQNSIPTATTGHWMCEQSVTVSVCVSECGCVLWLPHWPACRVMSSRGIASQQTPAQMRKRGSEHDSSFPNMNYINNMKKYVIGAANGNNFQMRKGQRTPVRSLVKEEM